MKFTALLEDGTVGVVTADTLEVGATATVELHDENGNPINATGVVVEILDVAEY